MQTHGPVVVDAFHAKFLLFRQRDRALSASAEELIKVVRMRQAEAEGAPLDIQTQDRLVCDIIRLTGTVYEDVREHLARPGADSAFADSGLSLVRSLTDEALAHLDAMPGLPLGQHSTPRIGALTAGLAHNIAVSLFEREMNAEGRNTARAGLDVLAKGQREGRSDQMSDTIRPLLSALAEA